MQSRINYYLTETSHETMLLATECFSHVEIKPTKQGGKKAKQLERVKMSELVHEDRLKCFIRQPLTGQLPTAFCKKNEYTFFYPCMKLLVVEFVKL